MWRKKDTNSYFVAYITLKVKSNFIWYLDSSCSKHMCGDRSLFKLTLKDIKGGAIAFGDRSNYEILGKANTHTQQYISS